MLDLDDRNCEHCGACTSVCPTKSVRLRTEIDHLRLSLNTATCTGCGRCVKICPMRVLELAKKKVS